MKKLAILAVAILGTFSMVNAQTTSASESQTKEVKATKHSKKGHKKSHKKAKGGKKSETANAETAK